MKSVFSFLTFILCSHSAFATMPAPRSEQIPFYPPTVTCTMRISKTNRELVAGMNERLSFKEKEESLTVSDFKISGVQTPICMSNGLCVNQFQVVVAIENVKAPGTSSAFSFYVDGNKGPRTEKSRESMSKEVSGVLVVRGLEAYVTCSAYQME